MICFNDRSGKDDLKDNLYMSNGGTSMFINILCLSGGRLAETESQKRFMVFLAEKNQYVCGIGTVGFDIVDMPWDRDSFDEDKAFILGVIEGARQKLGWETLGYEPDEIFAAECLDKFERLVKRMTVRDIIEGSLSEWLSGADENDLVRCGYPKCRIHDAYIGIHGCQVCTD